jgi:hypothetical protein
MDPTRRRWLWGAAGLGAGAVVARATAAQPAIDLFGPPDPDWTEPSTVLTIDLPQLQYPGRWNPRASAMRELASELRLRTRLEPVREPSAVLATSPALFATPSSTSPASRTSLPSAPPRRPSSAASSTSAA